MAPGRSRALAITLSLFAFSLASFFSLSLYKWWNILRNRRVGL